MAKGDIKSSRKFRMVMKGKKKNRATLLREGNSFPYEEPCPQHWLYRLLLRKRLYFVQVCEVCDKPYYLYNFRSYYGRTILFACGRQHPRVIVRLF